MNNILLDVNARLELYKSLRKDFGHVLLLFAKSECWSYETFCWLTRHFGTTLSFHLVTTLKGTLTERVEHFKAVIRLILMTAKDYWLFEIKEGECETKEVFKKRIGGLFLTYLLYNAQPKLPDQRLSIQIDCTEFSTLLNFEKQLDHFAQHMDIEIEDFAFFEACSVISKKLRVEACEVCAVPTEYGLYDELPIIRSKTDPEDFKHSTLELTMTYFKHHKFIKTLELDGKYNSLVHDSLIKIGEPENFQPFVDVVEELLDRSRSEWTEETCRSELSSRIVRLFGTTMKEAAQVSGVFLQTIYDERFPDPLRSNVDPSSPEAFEPPAFTWGPAPGDVVFFNTNGECNLEKFFSRFGLSSEDFGIDEMRFLDELRAAPSQPILPLPKPRSETPLERALALVKLDHSYCSACNVNEGSID